MNIYNTIKEMERITPPCQPSIPKEAGSYRMLLADWNPLSPKGKALFYQFTACEEKTGLSSVVPDGCANFFFRCDPYNPKAMFTGIVTSAHNIELEHGMTYFVVTPYSMLGTRYADGQCAELVDSIVQLQDVFSGSEPLIDGVACAESFNHRVRLFMDYARGNVLDASYSPSFLDYFAIIMCTRSGNLHFVDAEEMLGYSSRHCRECFKTAYGVSPKKYSMIIRFQNALKQLDSGASELSAVAMDCGYYDQAHFAHTFKSFMGQTPENYRALRKAQ